MSSAARDLMIRVAILLGFFVFLYKLVYTNEIILYVHPRFTSFIEIACVLFFLMLLRQCWKFKKTRELHDSHSCFHDRILNYLPFILTLLVAFLLPNADLNANMVNNRGLNSNLTNKSSSEEYRNELQQATFVKITDSNFLGVLRELTYHPEENSGKSIELKGFAYKSNDELPGSTSLVRYVVGCCAADAYPYGIICETADPAILTEGAWYEVQGTLQTRQVNGRNIPVIHITWVAAIDRPACPYIFPN